MKTFAAAAICAALSVGAHAIEKPWRVFDANGVVMGRLFVGLTGSGVELSLQHGQRVVVRLVPQQLDNGNYSPTKSDYLADYVYFTNSDCTGPAYFISNEWGVPMGPVIVSGSGTITLFPPLSDVLQNVTVKSFWSGGDCGTASGTAWYVPAGAPVDLTNMFLRPFSYR
jgi:hypothetical protein